MEFTVRIPFVDTLGFQLLRFEGGEAEIAFELREPFTNSWGVAHGGATMTLLDVVMAHAARSIAGETRGVVTLEMKTTFLRPGLGRLVGRGRLLHRSTSLAFCEGWVRGGAAGLDVAHATGTFKYMRGLPTEGRRVQRDGASD